jgi:AAA15 family ATPase/GTPase
LKKKKSIKKPPGLYDIDNFVVQNNVKKIQQKKQMLNIPIPIYKEFDKNLLENDINSDSVIIIIKLGGYIG